MSPRRRPQGPKNPAFWPTAGRLARDLLVHRWKLAVVTLSILVSVLLSVWAPKVLGRATDLVYAGAVGARMPRGQSAEQVVAALRARGQDRTADMLSGVHFVPGEGIDFHALGMTLLGVLALYAVSAFFLWLQGRVLNDVIMGYVYSLREKVEGKLNRLPLDYFDTHQRGDLLSRTTNDLDNLQQSLQQSVTSLVQSTLTLIGVTTMMFVISWQLALVALVALPLSAALLGLVGRRSQALYARQWKATGELNSRVEESFTGHDLVQAYGRQDTMRQEFEAANEEMRSAGTLAQFLSGTMMPVMQFVSYLGYVFIAVLGGLKVAHGTMSLGEVTAFIQYSREFNTPLGQVAGMANMLQSGVASAQRIFELLDAEDQAPDTEEARARTAELPERPRGEIEFSGVDFSYSPERPLIRDLSLTARPGQTVAVVGPTGAGKTTLVNLVMRFYEIDAGSITLDGVDLREMTRDRLRRATGMVLQDAVLFSGTIRENIRYGRLEATDEEVVAAAEATFVDRFVGALPEGYDTVVDQEGGTLSAGERQLVTIARAFLADPAVLILDEATSAVDTRTELLVQQAMAALRSSRTSFVIAHRLSTIRDADTILVMEQGRVVEQGTHEELVQAEGAYAALYRAQFEAGGADSQDEAQHPPVAWGP